MGRFGLQSRVVLVAAMCALCLSAAQPASATPDPLRGDQWALGAVGADVAWARSAGAGVVVAVVDSGVQLDHPDLAGGLWTNPKEVANGLDDDGNGIVDDLHGANMLDGGGDVSDDEGHGTAVAGIVAARAGNGRGGSGIAPRAQIMAVKVFGAGRPASSTGLARGVLYALGEGAQIINVSLNADAMTPELADAVRVAGERGATIVASAGNDARDTDLRPSYPSSLPDAAILSVTATGEDGRLVDGVNSGRRTVALAAPGDMIMTTAPGSAYELRAGTSMAAPLVAGALALLAGARPDLRQAQLRAALLASAARTRPLAGRVATGGLDVGAAMHALVPGSWGLPQRLSLRTAAVTRVGGLAGVRWSTTPASAVTRWGVVLDGRPVPASGRTLSARIRVRRAGRHRWRVTGYDAQARMVVSATRSFRARSGR
jgi:subtilisin family serine protease